MSVIWCMAIFEKMKTKFYINHNMYDLPFMVLPNNQIPRFPPGPSPSPEKNIQMAPLHRRCPEII